MADGSNLPNLAVGEKVDNTETDLVILYTFVTIFLIIVALSFSSIRVSNLSLFAGATVFVLPSVVSYIITDGNIIKSNVSASAQAFALVSGLLVMRMGGVLGGEPLSLFSTATSQGSYLGVLSTLGTGFQNVFNISLATRGENLFLMPIATAVILPVLYRLGQNLGIGLLENRGVLAVLSAIPIGLVFAVLHGARSVQFVLFATAVMVLWTSTWIYEGFDDTGLFPIVKMSILFSIGLHLGNNLNSSGSVSSLTGYIGSLLGSAEPALQVVGLIELVYWVPMFLLSGYYVYKYTVKQVI